MPSVWSWYQSVVAALVVGVLEDRGARASHATPDSARTAP